MRHALTAMSFAACIIMPGAAYAQSSGDPWEGLNRDLFSAHEGIDKAIVEPVARGYRAVTNAPMRRGVLNFLRNLRAPVIFANDVLQGEIARAGTTAARFSLNTTIGVAGIFDPASSMGLDWHDEDFGQTLAVWGVQPGPYVFVPLIGPTNLRDGAGRIVDRALDPLTWAEFEEIDTVRTSRTIMTGLAARELVLDEIEDLRSDALDPYASIRNSYGLLRDSAIQNGRTGVQDLPDFDDIPNETVSEAPTQTEQPNSPPAEPAPNTAKGDIP